MVARETSISSALAGSPLLPAGANESVVAIRRLEVFEELLRDVAIQRGFLGPGERDRIVGRHILESVGLSALVPADGLLIDVGSGAGLPGVALAILRRSPVVLVESQARRAAFLREVRAATGASFEVVHARAEDAARSDLRESARVVVARALADIAVTLELTLPFCAVAGTVVAPVGEPSSDPTAARTTPATDARSGDPPGRRGAGASADTRPAAISDPAVDRAAAELGGGEAAVARFEVPGAAGGRWAMIVNKLFATPEAYPRRPGIPQRRPLGGGDVA